MKAWYLPRLLAGVIMGFLTFTMNSRVRIRYILVIIILATLPCYCAGLLVVQLVNRSPVQPTPAPTAPAFLTATWTLFALPTFSLTPTFTLATLTPTFTGSVTPTLTPFFTPTSTQTLTLTSVPTDTPYPTPTDTLTPTLTETPTETHPPPPP
jgi:hypothetical protein